MPRRLRTNAYDPTRTTVLRNRFARDMKRRFFALARLVSQAVISDDVFGLDNRSGSGGIFVQQSPGYRAWEFATDSEKINRFRTWVNREVEAGVFSFESRPGTSGRRWTDRYIASSYQAGMRRGITESKRELRSVGRGGLELAEESEPIGVRFFHPVHSERVEVLYTRVWTELRKVTDDMAADMDVVLSQGLIEGRGPRQIGRALNKVITGRGGSLELVDRLGRRISSARRAEMIARTEVIRAHHMGNIQEIRNFMIPNVVVIAEWSTAGDHRVCPLCQDRAGKVYSLAEIEGLIPLHPLCRCVVIPVIRPVRLAA